MKFTENWLHEHLETNISIDELSSALTGLGLEVESVTDSAKSLSAFTAAKVIDASPHPNADQLKVCNVETLSGTHQVVCGAPNVHSGMVGVFAPIGSKIPGTGIKLKNAKIRGIESNGMLLSELELGVGEDHTGIIELDQNTQIGVPYATVVGLDDPIIEIAITPNRQDCLGVRGIARDLSAAGFGKFRKNSIAPIPGQYECPIEVNLEFSPETSESCPMFGGRLIRDVHNGPSPIWLQNRLRAIGLRPISARVDITNLVTHDIARPLHVFDADALSGNILVRLSQAGEVLPALDGRTHKLGNHTTVVADENGPLALGGIVGGVASSCTPDTVNVFIESALFDPVRTAKSGRELNIESDARYRFERGVDPESVIAGLEVGTKLVLDLCGGEPSDLVISGEPPRWQRTIDFSPSQVFSLGGLKATKPKICQTLRSLGFGFQNSGQSMKVSPPSWRSDIVGAADIVEEITRVHGYDKIEPIPLTRTTSIAHPAITTTQRRINLVRRVLAANGLIETVTWSFIPQKMADFFGGADPTLLISNPISAGFESMRPSLLPNLLAACRQNIDRGHDSIRLFELGPVYRDTSSTGQANMAAGVRWNNNGERHWLTESRKVDAFDAKADILRALDSCNIPTDRLEIVNSAPQWYHPGLSGIVKLGPKRTLGSFGSVHPVLLDELKIDGPVAAFELFLDSLPELKARAKTTKPPLSVSDLPAVSRDLAFVVDNSLPATTLEHVAKSAERQLIDSVQVFDVFVGESVGKNMKSVALSVRLQPHDKTLTDAEIARIVDNIVAAVCKATGGHLRE